MHPELCELAVPLSDRTNARRAGGGWQRGTLHPLGYSDAGDGAERRREIQMSDRLGNFGGGHFCRRRGTPDEWYAHQRVDVIGAFEQQTEVALQLAVIGGEEHVGVSVPSARGNGGEYSAAGLVDEFVLDVD